MADERKRWILLQGSVDNLKHPYVLMRVAAQDEQKQITLAKEEYQMVVGMVGRWVEPWNVSLNTNRLANLPPELNFISLDQCFFRAFESDMNVYELIAAIGRLF